MIAESLGRLRQQVRMLHRGGVDGRLLRAAAQQFVDLFDRANAAPYREGDKDVLGHALDHVHHGLARANGRGDIQEDQLIGPGVAVAGPQLDRIAGVAEIQKVDTLDNAIVFDVETRDDAFG